MQTLKQCPRGHRMEASWLRCPFCPPMPVRVKVPPTRIHKAPQLPAPRPKPTPPKRTALIEVAESAPAVAWLVGLQGAYKGRSFRLKPGKNTVGSDPGCDIQLDDAFVSARHANLTQLTDKGEEVFVLVDLDSINGTFLNSAPDPLHKVELVDSDRVCFGKLPFKFKCV